MCVAKLYPMIAVIASLALGACKETGPETSLTPPQDYSPRYAYIDTVSDDGRGKRVLVPEACLAADEASPADDGPPRLPPGCANNFNLQRMAERKSDLTRGRPIGDAPAAPAVRAAQGYIDGRAEPVLGGGIRPEDQEGGTDSPTPSVSR